CYHGDTFLAPRGGDILGEKRSRLPASGTCTSVRVLHSDASECLVSSSPQSISLRQRNRRGRYSTRWGMHFARPVRGAMRRLDCRRFLSGLPKEGWVMKCRYE